MIVGYAEWEDTQKDILDRVNAGKSVSSLAREYGITPSVMRFHVEKLRNRKKLLEENELYSSMYYSKIEVDAKMARRIVHCLDRVNVTTINDLQKFSIEELLNIQNLGLGQIEVMKKLGWIQQDRTKTKRSVGATTSLLSGEPCSWKQRCEELEQVIFKRVGNCKDCKYFEYDSVAIVDGIPLIVAHEICSKWGDGCKTREDGYCFLFEPKQIIIEADKVESEDEIDAVERKTK